jgi:hypothetical protein
VFHFHEKIGSNDGYGGSNLKGEEIYSDDAAIGNREAFKTCLFKNVTISFEAT